mmetsp:Transcript_73007/g.205672  ORF Transcript_73007/g.205672 Transcript_73007/m.205672 type:complete len:101 (+) Transcript_73007:2-304(+)
MKEGQIDFYYTTGESIAAVSSPPFLKTRKKGSEVMYMVDPLDEYLATREMPLLQYMREPGHSNVVDDFGQHVADTSDEGVVLKGEPQGLRKYCLDSAMEL